MKVVVILLSSLAIATAQPPARSSPAPPTSTCSDDITFADLADDGITDTSILCGDSARSYYKEFIKNDKRIIVTSGIPNHNYGDPNEECENWSYFELPLSPISGEYTLQGMGPIGVAITGGFFFNSMDLTLGVAALVEADYIDTCNGHFNANGYYHYHKPPVCEATIDNCALMGYMNDGFPVYGFGCGTDGKNLTSCYKYTDGADEKLVASYVWSSEDCDLDQANGYTFTNDDGTETYAYVLTEEYPWVFPGYYGTTTAERCDLSGLDED